MTSDYDLLRAVLDAPAADAPRLAYADWLAAAGEPDRARAIRAQVEADGTSADGGFTQELGGLGSRDVSASKAILGLGRSAWRSGYAARLHWRRGFVDRVELPAAAFLAHAAGLFAAHPIVAVRLTDKRPAGSEGAGGYAWSERPSAGTGGRRLTASRRQRATEGASELAAELFAGGLRRTGFETADLADDAVSAACVGYGRRLAGLAPLAWGKAVGVRRAAPH